MALDAVQLILEGLKEHSAEQFRKRELEMQGRNQESLAKEREAQIKQAQAELKERQRQFDITSKAAKAIHDMQIAREMQQIGLEGAKTGILPPGVNTAPAASSVPSGEPNYTPINPQQATSQNVTFPSGESMNIPLPTTFAKTQADISRITKRPEVEADIEKSRILQADLLKKQEEAKQSDFLRTLMMKQFDDERNAANIKAANWRAKLAANVELQKAKLNQDSDIDLGPYARDAIDGKMTIEDINRLPLKAPQKMKIIDTVKGTGAGILKNDQADLVKDFPQIIDTIKYMDDLISGQPQTTNKASGMLTGVIQTLNPKDLESTTAAKELKARASVVARFLREKGNLSNRDIERVLNMIPSVFNPQVTNIKLRDNFRDELDKLLDARLNNLPIQQRNIIKKRVGILDIGYYDKTKQGQSASQLDPKVAEELRRLGIQ